MSTDDPLELAWVALLKDWESDARHRAFVGLASSLGRLPDAAKHYKQASNDPRLAARTKEGIDRVLGAAMATLAPTSRAPRPKPINVVIPLAVLAAVLMATVVAARATGFSALLSPVVIVGEVLIVALLPWRRILRAQDDE